jgi:hypothetical protein
MTVVAPKQNATFAPEIKPKDHLKYSELFADHLNCIPGSGPQLKLLTATGKK